MAERPTRKQKTPDVDKTRIRTRIPRGGRSNILEICGKPDPTASVDVDGLLEQIDNVRKLTHQQRRESHLKPR